MTTADYYEDNAQDFFDGTVDVDMSALYQRFLPLVPGGGLILDAGCGSGRDSFYFKYQGYQVVAFDVSETLCKLASEHLNQTVHQLSFDEIAWQAEFDAVWACASLLHVTAAQQSDVMGKLIRSLKPGGVMYCSFKHGQGERVQGGRHFTDHDESSLRQLLYGMGVAKIDTWLTDDQRPGRDERWLNAIVMRD